MPRTQWRLTVTAGNFSHGFTQMWTRVFCGRDTISAE
jgi:hypothetical protein